ncbi:hypothetical protein ACQP2P_38695 [Dactylosporangium sp. CA-139114]|uniref:hypothetical protein n=1 Tax=Dactylosporangium sp. CA-139114 TaxID=3239931 RepID=UPI003D97AD76
MPLAKAVELGDLPTWISAMTTLFTASFAVVAARAARNLFLVESRRDAAIAEERAQSQAALVCAWTGWNPPLHHVPQSTKPNHGVYLLNASKLPVYDVRLDLYRDVRVNQADEVFPPTKMFGYLIGTLGPSQEAQFHPLPRDVFEHDEVDFYAGGDFGVAMVFRDASNRSWARDVDGRLSQRTDQP